jgi:hypothetical protein
MRQVKRCNCERESGDSSIRKRGAFAEPRRFATAPPSTSRCGVASRRAFAGVNSKTAHKKAEIEDHPQIVRAVLARNI